MSRLYDFGADTSNVSANERKAIAWPVAVWSCYIPESETQGINILEHLILQLVNQGFADPQSVLCRQVGFNSDLVGAAIEACKDKGYFDRRYKELKLSVDGNNILGKVDNPYSSDLEASKKNKKIYMIQDLVTKSVVPVFDIDKLPEFYVEDDRAIEISASEGGIGKKPKSASIKAALRYWARLCKNRRQGIVFGSNSIDMTEAPKQEDFVEDYIPFEDEVDWEDIQEDGSIKELVTLADKEEQDAEERKDKEIANITLLDDSPELYLAQGFIAINRNAPDEAIIISPFGNRLDDWFRTVINRLRACDEKFEEEIQFFLEEKRDELKDSIAFENTLNIPLFDRFPFICNRAEYADLKRAIETFTRTRNRIIAGEDETHNYTDNRATVLQIALRHLIDTHSELLQPKISFDDYKTAIQGLVYSYKLDEEILKNYVTDDKCIYNHMKSCKLGNGHITGYSALFLIDAWNNKHGKSMLFLRELPEFPRIIYKITRPRNISTHGNKGGNGKKGYAEMYISMDEAKEAYTELEHVLTALYSKFMEE